MTTLTILQTFKLLEEVQLPATFDKIVEVSNQAATDVALNLKLNMVHLDVDDRTSGAGTIYKLKYPTEYRNELRRQGRLFEYVIEPAWYDPSVFSHSFIICNIDKWTDITLADINTAINAYNVNPDNYENLGSYQLEVLYAEEIGSQLTGNTNVHVQDSVSAKPFVTGRLKEFQVTRLPLIVEILKTFGIVYEPELQMPEDWWTDLPGSLY